jgi:hypothetical protein
MLYFSVRSVNLCFTKPARQIPFPVQSALAETKGCQKVGKPLRLLMSMIMHLPPNSTINVVAVIAVLFIGREIFIIYRQI